MYIYERQTVVDEWVTLIQPTPFIHGPIGRENLFLELGENNKKFNPSLIAFCMQISFLLNQLSINLRQWEIF
jgi:hypothetical protein